MTDVVTALVDLPPLLALVVAVLLVAGETGVLVGLLFPVEITLLAVGFLASLGRLPFALVLVLMIVAAMVGDAVALRAGRRYGPRLRASRLGIRVGQRRWTRVDRLLDRYGGRSAFVARWVPFARTLLPRLAGSAGVPYRRFVWWNAGGVVTAVGSSVLLGYLAGASYQRVAALVDRAYLVLAAAALAGVAVVAGVRWWRRRRPGLPRGCCGLAGRG